MNEWETIRPLRSSYIAAVYVLFFALGIFAGGPTANASSVPLSDTSTPFGTAQPVSAVILADESGSMQDYASEVAGERQAAAQIVQEEWSPQSKIAIYGFGSAPDERGAQAQAAIDQYCAPTELTNNAARTTLAECAAEIKPRTEAQGYNTDFAAALTQALDVLSASSGTDRLPLVFILTDGQLDEGPNSPYAGWGSTDAAGTAAAQELITNPSTGILRRLREAGAEVWPVGFGEADSTELNLFAKGGAQNACPAGSGAIPSATIIPPSVTGPEETEAIQSDLVGAFAEARCAVSVKPAWKNLPSGGSVTETVTISPLATLGSLVVDKGDPRVTVTYTDPAGHEFSDRDLNGQISDSVDGAAYVLTGQSQSPLETVRLDDPLPGPWKVTFTSAPGVSAQMVGLSLVWQGEVQLEFIKQAIGEPGQPYTLAFQVATRSAPVQARALAGFMAGFTVQWAGGQQSAVKASLDASGDFDATVMVPQNANGIARATATLAGPGIQGQEGAAFHVNPGGGLTVALNIPPGTTVAPGGTITAQATVYTNGLSATSIVFSLGNLGDGVLATLSPAGQVQIGSGRQSIPVVIRFGPRTRLGPALGTIQWAPANQGTPTSSDWLAIDSLDVDIEYPPTPFVQQPWFLSVLSVAFAAAIGAGVLLLVKRRRDREEAEAYGAGRTTATARPDRFPIVGGGGGPRRPTDRFAVPNRSSATTGQEQTTRGTTRGARWGWRLPWK